MSRPQSVERLCLGLLIVVFICFTWRGMLMFYSGDDMMNMYYAWNVNPWRLGRALVMMWVPTYRPLGQIIYRIFYEAFGFHPLPLYVFSWVLLTANVLVAYRFLKTVSGSVLAALTGVSLILVHGQFQDLYSSAGTIYDRLCFLFTAVGIAIYARSRRRHQQMPIPTLMLLTLVCMLAMDSKESGIALPVLLACYEGLVVLPEVWKDRQQRVRAVKGVAVFYCLAVVLAMLFVFGRVRHTPELATTAAYEPHFDLSLWLNSVAGYLSTLVYGAAPLSGWFGAILLVALLALAWMLRSRAMVFGWIFFVVTITPVALISQRPGYVLYVPELGLALYFGTLLARLAPAPALTWRGVLIFLAIAGFSVRAHAAHWGPMFASEYQPERRVTEQFRRDYPKLAPGSQLLFAKDDFPPRAWDLTFNLRLLYGDKRLVVHRLMASTDELPPKGSALQYDHIFSLDARGYSELDNADIARSLRLNILRDYPPGRHFDTDRRDRAGYILSGISDFEGDAKGRWTAGEALLKFDVYPADSTLSLRFWVADFIAKTPRSLSVYVNDHLVGSQRLNTVGMNQISFPTPAAVISKDDYTIVKLKVDPPYVTPDGQQQGVVLLRVDFDYVGHAPLAK